MTRTDFVPRLQYYRNLITQAVNSPGYFPQWELFALDCIFIRKISLGKIQYVTIKNIGYLLRLETENCLLLRQVAVNRS